MNINQIINLTTHGKQSLGYLSFFESDRDIPFSIKRIYYTYDVPLGTIRGKHAHKNLKQLLWCPYGMIEVILDDGVKKELYKLDSPSKGLLIGSGIWREMIWKKDGSVLCVAASDYYNEGDYIRDYVDFKKYVKEGYWNDGDKF